MIRSRHLSAVFVMVFILACQVAQAAPAVSKADALHAIDVFKKDPSSKDGFTAAATIMEFAQKSPLVHISLSKDVAPWLKKDTSDADTREILLNAYVAGNVEAQLKSGKAADDIYAGWEQVLDTYAQLLHINSAAKIEEVEELKSKDQDGHLRAYADELAAKK